MPSEGYIGDRGKENEKVDLLKKAELERGQRGAEKKCPEGSEWDHNR